MFYAGALFYISGISPKPSVLAASLQQQKDCRAAVLFLPVLPIYRAIFPHKKNRFGVVCGTNRLYS